MKRFLTLTIAVVTVIALTALSACGTASSDSFDSDISALEYTSSPKYAYISSLEELLNTAKPNLIICGKVTSRETSAIVDYSGKFDDSYLSSSAAEDEKIRCAAEYLATPYAVSIDEVLLGEDIGIEITASNITENSVTINAPYGILDGYSRRDGLYPILKVGQEYLFFLRTDNIYGKQIYYLAFPPVSAIELKSDGKFDGEYGDYIDLILGEYENSSQKLLEALRNLITSE